MAAETAARAEKEEAHRDHAALAIRQGLKPGDPHPVCAQAVKTVPKGKAAAAAQRDVLQARLQELEKKAVAADKALEEAQYALGKLAARDGWTKLLPPPMGRDEADVVESQRSERQRDATAAQSKVATLTHEVQTTEKSLVRAAALVEKRTTLDKESALTKTLSSRPMAGAGKSRASSTVSSRFAGSGQDEPALRARSTYSETVPRRIMRRCE